MRPVYFVSFEDVTDGEPYAGWYAINNGTPIGPFASKQEAEEDWYGEDDEGAML